MPIVILMTLKQRSVAQTKEELIKTNDVIKATLGITPIWFAPSSGSFNVATIQVADQFGMKTILWTVDTVDWRKPATSEMVRRVGSKSKEWLNDTYLCTPQGPLLKAWRVPDGHSHGD